MVELLDEPGYPPTEARCTIELDAKGIGRSVALVFENGDARSPIVIGELPPVAAPSANDAVVFDFDRNVVFRCGEASITLTPAGKVLIQGKFVLTHSSGLNRIRGAAVQIN